VLTGRRNDSVDAITNNSSKYTKIICAVHQKESENSIEGLMKLSIDEIEEIKKNGLDVDGVRHNFVFKLSSDYKMIRLLYGLGGAASTYCCIYCDVKQKELLKYENKNKERKLQDLILASKRLEEKLEAIERKKRSSNNIPVVTNNITPTIPNDDKESKKKKKRKPLTQREKESKKSEYMNQKYPPIVTFEISDCIIDILHLKINMTRKFEDIRNSMCEELGNERVALAKKIDKELKIYRKITGLTGKQGEKIFRNVDKW
jgi:hypothetical protein